MLAGTAPALNMSPVRAPKDATAGEYFTETQA